MQAALYEGAYIIVQLLLEHGADVNAQGGPYGNSFLVAKTKGNKEIVELLSEQGAVNVVF